MGIALIVAGVIGILVSGTMSTRRFKSTGLPAESWKHTAGTGLVPQWVSFMNLASWVVLALGVVLLFV